MTVVGRRHTGPYEPTSREDGVRVERVVEVHVQVELAAADVDDLGEPQVDLVEPVAPHRAGLDQVHVGLSVRERPRQRPSSPSGWRCCRCWSPAPAGRAGSGTCRHADTPPRREVADEPLVKRLNRRLLVTEGRRTERTDPAAMGAWTPAGNAAGIVSTSGTASTIAQLSVIPLPALTPPWRSSPPCSRASTLRSKPSQCWYTAPKSDALFMTLLGRDDEVLIVQPANRLSRIRQRKTVAGVAWAPSPRTA